MSQPHKHADILRAIADGKEVQCRALGDFDYGFFTPKLQNPITDHGLEWRVKPEPKPDVVHIRRVGQCIDGDLYMALAQTCAPNIRFTFDGETGRLKKAEVIG